MMSEQEKYDGESGDAIGCLATEQVWGGRWSKLIDDNNQQGQALVEVVMGGCRGEVGVAGTPCATPTLERVRGHQPQIARATFTPQISHISLPR
jgi:hypothetical protein